MPTVDRFPVKTLLGSLFDDADNGDVFSAMSLVGGIVMRHYY
jgi:hypothetical protein